MAMTKRLVAVDGEARARWMTHSEFWALRTECMSKGLPLPRTVKFEDDGPEDACPAPHTDKG